MKLTGREFPTRMDCPRLSTVVIYCPSCLLTKTRKNFFTASKDIYLVFSLRGKTKFPITSHTTQTELFPDSLRRKAKTRNGPIITEPDLWVLQAVCNALVYISDADNLVPRHMAFRSFYIQLVSPSGKSPAKPRDTVITFHIR